MCGIAGAVSLSKPLTSINVDIHALSKRGPDDSGVFQDNHVMLAHRRLSIIDLSTGHQPMESEDGSVILVYNGEIYNFLQLKAELLEKGKSFRTTSDTEVIIQGYREYGINILLQRLEGMFAFALYDKAKNKCYIARDKYGEKPLYYNYHDNVIYFASELKALNDVLKTDELDHKAINLFLTLSYIPAPYTIYKHVSKLVPGHFIEASADGAMQINRYYDIRENISKRGAAPSYEEAKAQLKKLVFKSVEQRMISDVPFGAFLSGGIDSSIISAVMARIHNQQINTFSIGFNEAAYDESQRAELVSKHIGSKHEVFFLDFKHAYDMLDQITSYFDEPFGDSSAIPSFFVSKMAASKVKVVLTGDAADELFGGYEKYLAPYYSAKYMRVPKPARKVFEKLVSIVPHTSLTNHTLRKIKKVVNNSGMSHFDLHYTMMSLGFTDTERAAVVEPNYLEDVKGLIRETYDAYNCSGDPMDKGFYTDLTYVLEGDMLTKVDRMCMINSLEARVPFLDSKIVEFAYSLPLHYKINGTNKKRILKETFADLLPGQTMNFSKKGFGVPVNLWMKTELKQEMLKITSRDFIEKQGIFKYDYVQKLYQEHLSGAQNHTFRLWNLYIFQKWYSRNVIKAE